MTGDRAVVATALTLLALVSVGEAQTPLLVPGVRVRVTSACLANLASGPAQCDVVVGRLRSWTPDSVIVQQGSGTDRAVARRTTRLVEVSDGIRSRKWLGTAIGAAVGLGVGVAVPCNPKGSAESPTLDYVSCTLFRWILVPIAIGVGAGAGRLVGTMIRSESWVSLGGDVATVGIAPRGAGGFALAVNVRF